MRRCSGLAGAVEGGRRSRAAQLTYGLMRRHHPRFIPEFVRAGFFGKGFALFAQLQTRSGCGAIAQSFWRIGEYSAQHVTALLFTGLLCAHA